MKKEELLKGLTYLGTAYNKEYSQVEAELYYDFLKEYSYRVFINSIKETINESKYLPKISELVEKCNAYKKSEINDVVEYMKQVGYFKDIIEYDKAYLFIEQGTVPKWLQQDMNKYYKQMIQNNLNHKGIKLLNE